jgi:hypothetical protein
MTVKDLEKYQDYLKDENSAHKKAQIELRKLNRFVVSCPDPVIRSIIINRYIKGLSWTAVAMRIGGNVTDDNCRKMLTRYLMKKK